MANRGTGTTPRSSLFQARSIRDFAAEMQASTGDDLGPMIWRDVQRLAESHIRLEAMLRVALAFVPGKVKYGVYDATTHEMLTSNDAQRLLDEAPRSRRWSSASILRTGSERSASARRDTPASAFSALFLMRREMSDKAVRRTLCRIRGHRFGTKWQNIATRSAGGPHYVYETCKNCGYERTVRNRDVHAHERHVAYLGSEQ